jgi:hypothetical protein
MVGQTPLMQRGLLLVHPSFGALTPGLLRGYPGTLLSDLSPLLALSRILTMLGYHPLTSLIEFTLTAPDARSLAHPRHQQGQHNQRDYDNHNDDDHNGGHVVRHPFLSIPVPTSYP